MQEKW